MQHCCCSVNFHNKAIRVNSDSPVAGRDRLAIKPSGSGTGFSICEELALEWAKACISYYIQQVIIILPVHNHAESGLFFGG